jgi:hypothetical protein
MSKNPAQVFDWDQRDRVIAKKPEPVKMGNQLAHTLGTGVGVGYENHGNIVKQHGDGGPSKPKGRPMKGYGL